MTDHKASALRFGSFIAPFQALRDDPTLAIERDMELVRRAGRLGL